MAQSESKRFTLALVRALDHLGPIRTLELVGDKFLSAIGDRHEAAYTAAVPHIVAAMNEFEGRRAPFVPADPNIKLMHTSDECPKCSRIGKGPLCKSHRVVEPPVEYAPGDTFFDPTGSDQE